MIGVIWFPGVNCENETKLACEAAGMRASIVRWNANIEKYDGYVLPGGWSYEDRVRAGAIASKDLLLTELKKQSRLGKPILGICNGCQVLVESGLISSMGLAPNVNTFVSGYYCTWVKIKNTGRKNAFNSFYEKDEIIDIPIAHGEGRFVVSDLAKLEKSGHIAFKYCDEDGNVSSDANPNGSMGNIAGVCNAKGNVLAMMPHPERAFFKKQLPNKEMVDFNDAMSFAKGAKIFKSMREYIKEMKK